MSALVGIARLRDTLNPATGHFNQLIDILILMQALAVLIAIVE